MSTILRQKSDFGKGKILKDDIQPVVVVYKEGIPNVVCFSNGEEANASCLRCHDAPCMNYKPEETLISTFPDFPADRSDEVCAAKAITREKDAGAPDIDTSLCMYCGVCAARCPVGAIHMVPGKGAVLEDGSNKAFIETANHPKEQMIAMRDKFAQVKRMGIHLTESDSLISDLEGRLNRAAARIGDHFQNLLTRNLFVSVGIGAAMRRKGNNNMRMDLIIGPPGAKHGVAEVEFGDEAILDAPRDIMDDVAVLVARYGWVEKEIVAVVVGDIMPNRRSEYWRIIQDIGGVLGVRIGTISILALLLANWNRMKLHLDPSNGFYADCDTGSYRTKVVEAMLGRALKLVPLPRSFVEPVK